MMSKNSNLNYRESAKSISLNQLMFFFKLNLSFIIFFTALITLISSVYVFFFYPPEVYKASISFTKTSQATVEKINRSNLISVSDNLIYKDFLENINSRKLQIEALDELQYFENNSFINRNSIEFHALVNDFLNSLNLSISPNKFFNRDDVTNYESPYTLSMKGSKQQIDYRTSYLTKLTQLADQKTITKYANLINIKKEKRLKELNNKINIETFYRQKQNEIEAANRKSLSRISNSFGLVDFNFESRNNNLIPRETPEWYSYGEKALLLESDYLLNKKYYDKSLAILLGEKSLLDEYEAQFNDISAIEIENYAFPELMPRFQPTLILVILIIVGFLTSILLTLLISIVNKTVNSD